MSPTSSSEVLSAPPPSLGHAHQTTNRTLLLPTFDFRYERSHLQEEEASTQTSDLDVSTSEMSEGPMDDDESTDEQQHIMQRITNQVGRLFSQDRRDRGTQTAKDPVTSDTERLAFDIVFFVLGRRSSKAKDDVAQCLRRSVVNMLEKHSIVFNSMVNRLSVNRDSDLSAGFSELSNTLFVHNEVSWSKIIALFAFGARLAQYCEENAMPGLVLEVASNLSQYATEKLTPFIRQHGGWATLCEAFPQESDFESKIWHSLLLTGLGLTAVAAFLAFQH